MKSETLKAETHLTWGLRHVSTPRQSLKTPSLVSSLLDAKLYTYQCSTVFLKEEKLTYKHISNLQIWVSKDNCTMVAIYPLQRAAV